MKRIKTRRLAFTMAEILLSLTIIGVVAAITLPSLMANINERTWNTQRKALYARMSQAIAMMPQVGGYGTLTEDESGSVTEDTAAETFLTEGLSKVLKINNICDNEHLADCGVPISYTNMAGSVITWPTTVKDWNNQFVGFSSGYDYDNDGVVDDSMRYSQTDTKAAAFETQNGEIITLYYNPNCENMSNGWQMAQSKMCANFIYDLNGNKGPNTVGKDIGFITTFNNDMPSTVAPMPLATNAGNGSPMIQQNASTACTTQDNESRVPNVNELLAMYYNKKLINIPSSSYWSNSLTSNDTAWTVFFAGGSLSSDSRSRSLEVRCIKR